MISTDYTLTFDWIQLTAKGELPTISEGFQVSEAIYLEPKDYKTKFYQNICDVYCYGQKVAEMEFNPHSKILDPLSVMIKMSNEVCYEENISSLIKSILTDCGLQFNNWTRLDFALDGSGILEPLRKAAVTTLMGKDSPNAEIRLVGKSDITTYMTHDGQVKGIYVGGRSSDKSLLGYSKSLELKLSGKSYIQDFWERNNLKPYEQGEEVERLEIRCKGAELKRYKIFDPARNYDPVGILDRLMKSKSMFENLFQSLTKKLYEFIDVNEARTDTAERLYKLNLLNVGKRLMQKVSRLASSELGRMKQAAKTLYWIAEATGKKFYNQLAQDVAKMIEHEKWFIEKKKNWKQEYRIRDGSRRFQFISGLTDDPHYEQLRLFEIPAVALKLKI